MCQEVGQGGAGDTASHAGAGGSAEVAPVPSGGLTCKKHVSHPRPGQEACWTFCARSWENPASTRPAFMFGRQVQAGCSPHLAIACLTL